MTVTYVYYLNSKTEILPYGGFPYRFTNTYKVQVTYQLKTVAALETAPGQCVQHT